MSVVDVEQDQGHFDLSALVPFLRSQEPREDEAVVAPHPDIHDSEAHCRQTPALVNFTERYHRQRQPEHRGFAERPVVVLVARPAHGLEV